MSDTRDRKDFLKIISSSSSHDSIEKKMDHFLRSHHQLSVANVAFVVAAYAYSSEDRDFRNELQMSYPGVENVGAGRKNKLVGKDYLRGHCAYFAKKHRQKILTLSDRLKAGFYKIFAIRFDSEAESKKFDSHKGDIEVVKSARRLLNRKQVMKDNEEKMLSHLQKLKSNYVFITGAGVSAQLVQFDPTLGTKDPSFITVSSWGGLIKLVRKSIGEFVGATIQGYFEKWHPVAVDDHPDTKLMDRARMLYGMIRVYNLYYGADIDYTRFISRLFHSVAPTTPTPALATALGSRNVPIATTNYDMLQEACLNRFEYNLAENVANRSYESEMKKMVYSNYKHHIYHLHGVWHSKAELTLGVEYAESASNFRNAMRALTREHDSCGDLVKFDTSIENLRDKAKPIVFVGTASGVFDKHFLTWLLDKSYQTHYILIRNAEFENINDTIIKAGLRNRLVPVVYGVGYPQLAPFVSTLPQRNIV